MLWCDGEFQWDRHCVWVFTFWTRSCFSMGWWGTFAFYKFLLLWRVAFIVLKIKVIYLKFLRLVFCNQTLSIYLLWINFTIVSGLNLSWVGNPLEKQKNLCRGKIFIFRLGQCLPTFLSSGSTCVVKWYTHTMYARVWNRAKFWWTVVKDSRLLLGTGKYFI